MDTEAGGGRPRFFWDSSEGRATKTRCARCGFCCERPSSGLDLTWTLEAGGGIHTDSCLLEGHGPPTTAPSCASWASSLCLPWSALPSALPLLFCFGFFLLLSCSLPCSLVGSHQRSRCLPRGPLGCAAAHAGAGHGSTCPPRTHLRHASGGFAAGQLATAVAAGSPQAPQRRYA